MADYADYVRRRLNHEQSPLAIKTERFSTGAVGAPFDIQIGWTNTIWFTGAGNAIGRLDNARKLALFTRKDGVRPRFMTEGQYGEGHGGGFWFSDPEGGRVGFVASDGTFEAAVDFGGTAAPRALARTAFKQLVATNDGRLIELGTQREIKVKQRIIDAVGFGPQRAIWYAAGGALHCLDEFLGEVTVNLPGPRNISELVAGHMESLYYWDESQDIVGVISPGRTSLSDPPIVMEFELPNGTGPRAVTVGYGREPWFTGRQGKAVFRIGYERTLTEYKTSDASSDLTRLQWNGKEMWFAEPAHSALSVASVAGF